MGVIKVDHWVFDLRRDDAVFCQFTGLKDKSGKEIYEGDILAVWHVSYPVEKWRFLYEVYYKAPEFRMKRTAKQTAKTQVEIIGNIYENGDLLK